MKLDEDEKELAGEVLSSPGWRIFVHRILRKRINDLSDNVFLHARHGNALEGAKAIAKRDIIFDFLEDIYKAAGHEFPENLKALKRGD